MAEQNNRFSVPPWVVAWTAAGILALFAYLVRSVLPPFLIGAAGAYIASPVVANLQERRRLPRAAAIALVYLAVLVPIALLAVFFGPRFFEETRQLVLRTDRILAQILDMFFGPGPYTIFGPPMDSHQVAMALIDSIRGSVSTPGTAFHLVSSVAEVTLNAFLSLVVSIYLLADSANVRRVVMGLVPTRRRAGIDRVSEEIHLTLARYLQRELFLVGLVSAASFLGLEFIFHLRFALSVAIFTGVVEIVPFLGPITAGTVAALVALTQGGPQMVLGIIVFYFALRQVEDQLVMPVVLGRAVQLHPLVVIFAVLAGGALFGVLGTLAAVPVAASIRVMLNYWPKLTAPPDVARAPDAEAPRPS